MSANSKIKWSEVPYDRPFSVALSQQEVIVLVKWHTAQAKRIPQIAGKAAMMNLMTGGPLKARDSRTLFEEAGEILARHTTRAMGLLSILQKK
jgi:hypothetical protein